MSRSPGAAAFLVQVLVVAAATGALGRLAGLGPATTLAAVTALLALLAATGGTTRGDLRLLAVLAPLLAVAAAGPALLALVSGVGAAALVVVLVAVAGVLPGLGGRWAPAGLALAGTVLFGEGAVLTDAADLASVVGAPFLGLVVAAVVRLLAGARDPHAAVRAQVADVLVAPDADLGEALRTWSTQAPERWTGRALAGAARYRSARERLPDGVDADPGAGRLDAEAAEVAALLRARRVPEPGGEAAVGGADPADPADPADRAHQALHQVRAAAATRTTSETTLVDRGAAAGSTTGVALRETLTWRSARLRRALLSALAVAAALAVARLGPGGPLALTFLLVTLAVVQPRWTDDLARAGRRGAAGAAGAVAALVALWTAPAPVLTPLALGALLVGVWCARRWPEVLAGGTALAGVGLASPDDALAPGALLVEHLLLLALGAGIGLLAVAGAPGRRPALHERLERGVVTAARTVEAAADALRGVERDDREQGDRAGGAMLLLRARDAARAREDLLVPDAVRGPGRARDDLDHLVVLAGALAAVADAAGAIAARAAGSSPRGPAAPGAVAAVLDRTASALREGHLPEVVAPGVADEDLGPVLDVLLAAVVVAVRRRSLLTPAGTPSA